MKQIIIGDIHGLTCWRRIVEYHPDADRIIFIGDYLDSFDISPIEQLNNLEAICEFKKSSNKEVILLVGNHDHHYWPGVVDTGTSGYQPHMATSFEYCFSQNKDLFQMCFVDEKKTVYSHAGMSRSFMRAIAAHGTDKFDFINELFKTKPRYFCYNNFCYDHSGCGEHVLQSCIWIRPGSLYKDKIQNLQVVGHTPVGRIDYPAKSERRNFYLIDCLPKEYLFCQDGVFKIEKLS